MLKPSTAKEYFTLDIGSDCKAPLLFGPLVLTYIDPAARVVACDGHPQDAEADAPKLASLDGLTFKGEFFVGYGQSITGETNKALVSGFYPYPGLPLAPRIGHSLPCGAELYYNYHRDSNLVLSSPPGRSAEQIEALKREAIHQAQDLMCCMLDYSKWEPGPDGKKLFLAVRPMS